MKAPSYVLIVLTPQAGGEDYPLVQRIRRLLKHASRTCCLRCLYVDYNLCGDAAGQASSTQQAWSREQG
jgi:hypothetical protein